MYSLIQSYSQKLEKIGHDNAKRTIEELLAHHLNCSPLEIYNFESVNILEFEKDFKRLLKNEPLQYMIGTVNFYGIELKCDKRALIPRPETEKLIEIIFDSSLKNEENSKIIDVGTGSGCIAIALATKFTNTKIQAIDISKEAIEMANENVKRLQLSNRINVFYQDNLFKSPDKSFNAVISNPPYISSKEWLELPNSVKVYEPRIALEAGSKGTEFYEILIPEASRILKNKGLLFLEIGHKQAEKISEILNINGFENICIEKDFQGHDRIIHAIKLN